MVIAAERRCTSRDSEKRGAASVESRKRSKQMNPQVKPPCRLSRSFVIDKREAAMHGAMAIADRELYARRDLGIKLLEWLEVDQPITVCLNRTCSEDYRRNAIVTTFDLKIAPVETMNVVVKKIVMKEVEVGWKHETIPDQPIKSNPGVLGRLWDGWKKHVDQCRESLGG